MFGILLSVVTFGLVVFALIDLIITDSSLVKHLPKIVWVIIILILPLIGSIIWILVGKDRVMPDGLGAYAEARRRTSVPRMPMTGSAVIVRETTPEEDEARVEAEIAYHENQARIRRLQAKLEAERKGRANA